MLNHPEVRDVIVGDSLNRVLGNLARLGDYLLLAKASARPIHTSLVKKIPFLYSPTGKTMTLEQALSERAPVSFRRSVISRDPERFMEFARKVAASPEISVGELVIFMNGFGLRFGVAEGVTERGTYMILQNRLSSVRKEIMDRPAEAGLEEVTEK